MALLHFEDSGLPSVRAIVCRYVHQLQYTCYWASIELCGRFGIPAASISPVTATESDACPRDVFEDGAGNTRRVDRTTLSTGHLQTMLQVRVLIQTLTLSTTYSHEGESKSANLVG